MSTDIERGASTPVIDTGVAIGTSDAPTEFVDLEGRTLAYRSIGSGPEMIWCNRFRDRGVHALDLFGVRESGLPIAQLLKRANHQAGTDQQHQRERHLHRDERVPRAMVFPAVADGPADAAEPK